MISSKFDKHDEAVRWARIDSKVKEHRLLGLFNALNSSGIDAILLKGWSLARFYPSDSPRAYTDIDIAVEPRNFELTRSQLRSSSVGSQLDLHEGFRQLDLLSWEEIYSRSFIVDLNGTPIRVLSDEDNLRVTAVHWLLDGGVYREKLWDIYYLVTNRECDFDWERCLDANGSIRKTWVIAAIAAAIEYLDLETGSLPDEVKNSRLPEWFRQTLAREWRLGPYARVPLRFCFRSPKLLFEQVRRRVPPNRIAATVEMEEPIDDSSRMRTQYRSARKRAASLLRQLTANGE